MPPEPGTRAKQAHLAFSMLEALLRHAHQDNWLTWAHRGIELADKNQIDPDMGNVFAGAGSFNDFSISSHEQVTWANELLEALRLRLSSILSPPASGALPANWQSILVNQQLKGWRCLLCDRQELSHGEIEQWVAVNVLSTWLNDENLTQSQPEEMVASILAGDVTGAAAFRSGVEERAHRSGIAITDRTGWMSPCPDCGRADTAVHRWVDSDDTYISAPGTLSLRPPGYRYRPDTTTNDLIERFKALGSEPIDGSIIQSTRPHPLDDLIARSDVIEALRGLRGNTYLVYYDDITKRAEWDAWIKIGDYCWQIPATTHTLTLLQGELEVDIWQMYQADHAVDRNMLPNLFNDSLGQEIRKFESTGISALVDSWMNNRQWRLISR